VPRFDSGACFASLLGGSEHGHWSLAPRSGARAGRHHYREGTPVLETRLDADDGAVRLLDAIPLASRPQAIVRIVEGLRGRVPMRMDS
jgi:GH15 family glucan-1,4-alpha-glucosidase